MKRQIIIIAVSLLVWQGLYAQKDSIVYFPNGNIMKKARLENGKLNGPYVEYHENGKLGIKTNMVNGNPEGKLEMFDENGLKAQEHIIENGIVKSSRAFQSLDHLFYLFRDEATSKLGLQNKSTGREVLPPVYIGIYKMNNEYYTIVKDQEQYGLMHHSGKVVVPAIYDEEIKDFAADKPFPVKKSGKYGFLNPQGKLVVPFVYDWASSFSDRHFGYATVRKDGKQGMIDKEGEVVIPI